MIMHGSHSIIGLGPMRSKGSKESALDGSIVGLACLIIWIATAVTSVTEKNSSSGYRLQQYADKYGQVARLAMQQLKESVILLVEYWAELEPAVQADGKGQKQ